MFVANGNSIVAISSGAALPVSSYTADSTSPTLLTFTINLNTNTMVMNFDEPVDVGAFNANSATFQATQSGATGSSVPLTGGSAVVSSDGLQVTLRLIPADVNSVTAATDLAVSANTTFLQFTGSPISNKAEDTEHTRLHPGGRPVRMLVQEISTSRDLLSVQIAEPIEMQPACSLLTSDDQRVALPRDIVDSLYRGERRAHR